MTDEAQQPEEYEFEGTTREETIAACYNCIAAVEALTPLTKTDTNRIERIRRRCLRILDYYSKEMYDEIFEEEED